MTAASSPAVRLLTWNIHGGVGADGRCDLDRIVALVKRHEPDIVALQEVDSRRSGDAPQPFVHLAETLGAHAVEAKTILAPDGEYGQLVISRWPLSGTALHDISVDGREPRRAVEATVHTPAGPLHLVAVHLGLSFRERRWQAEKLASIARAARGTSVMLGDFNDWIWRGSVVAAVSRELPGRTWIRTFPARWPLIRLDRVHCRPSEALLASWTDPAARLASDHLPVVAEVAVSG